MSSAHDLHGRVKYWFTSPFRSVGRGQLHFKSTIIQFICQWQCRQLCHWKIPWPLAQAKVTNGSEAIISSESVGLASICKLRHGKPYGTCDSDLDAPRHVTAQQSPELRHWITACTARTSNGILSSPELPPPLQPPLSCALFTCCYDELIHLKLNL